MGRYHVECIKVHADAREESMFCFVEAAGPEAAQAEAEARAEEHWGHAPTLTILRIARYWPGPH